MDNLVFWTNFDFKIENLPQTKRHKSNVPILKNAHNLLLQFVLKLKTRANLDHLDNSNSKKSNILDDIIFSKGPIRFDVQCPHVRSQKRVVELDHQ